ncbi:MAG: Ig-like domain-containing protein [Clostridia bacterium]|nr:Ig-like domain-containing protein [Clostridia bacterium]
MKMKKILVNLLLSVMMVTSMFFAGCKKPGNEGGGQGGGGGTPPPASAPTISLSADKTLLTVGEYTKVTATNYLTVDGQELVFTSSNPSAITVDENGNVEAISAGDSLVSVTYGEAKAQIKMTSTFNNLVPELLVDGLMERTVSNVDSDKIEPYIYFNNRRFGLNEGLAVEYSSTDTSLITVNQDGVVSGVAGAKGDATIVIKASWRGFTSAKTFSLQKEIEYHVDENTVFMVNGDTARTYELYTKVEFGGQNYVNEIDFVCTATYGETDIPTEDITVAVANPDMAEFQNGKLIGKAFGENGETTVILSFTQNGRVYSKVIPITVIRPVASYADRVKYFSSFTGNYKDETDNYKDKSLTKKVFGDTPIVDIYQGDTRLEFDASGNILGVTGNFDSVADVTLRIGTQTERYDVSVDVYTKVIQNRKDIENTFHVENAGHFVTGYCEMINDVDMNGFTFYHRAYIHASSAQRTADLGGFRGVFNGNGYTISNFSTYTANQGGFFLYIQGYEGNEPAIKNVAFVDVKTLYTDANKTGSSILALGVTAKTTFENIYVKTAADSGQVLGLIPSFSEKTIFMKNVYVEDTTSTTINPLTEDKHTLDANGKVKATGNGKYGFGSLFKEIGITSDDTSKNFNNVVVVSSKPLTYFEGNDITFQVSKLEGYKDGADPTLTIKTINKDTNKTSEVIRYNPYYYAYGANQTKTWDNKDIPTNSTHQNYEKFSVKLGAYYYKTTQELASANHDFTSFATDDSECWIIKNGVPVWRSSDKESYYTTENGKLNSITIELNETKLATNIGVTNYTDVDFDITSAVSNNEFVKATVNSDNKSIKLEVAEGYADWDNTKNVEITITFADNQPLVAKVALTSIVKKIDEEVLFSAADGVFHGNNVVAHANILEAYQVNEGGALSTLTLTREGYILGVKTNITNGFTEVGYVTIRVYTKDGKWYQFNKVKAYSGILTKGVDLKWFEVETADDKHKGFYIVGNNIDAKKVAVQHVVNNPGANDHYNQIPSTNSGGFQGTFDGQGYTISNMFAFKNGIFGRIFNDEEGETVIKNIGFANVSLDSLSGTYDNGKQVAAGPLFARFTPDTVLENVGGVLTAKYQTTISNVYIQTKVPNVGPAYQGGLFYGIFNAYCEHNLVNETPVDTPSSTNTKIPEGKRAEVVSFKLVDCFFDYSNSNEQINQKLQGSYGGGLIVSGSSGAVTYDTQGNYTNVSEAIKNSRYENLFIASKYPLAVSRTSQDIPGYPECPTKVLVSEMGKGLQVAYASTMAGQVGYTGWEWIPYDVALADRDKYDVAIKNGHLPSWMEERGIDYRVCGQISVFDPIIDFANDVAVDNDVNKGIFFYTNINQYGTLADMATAYAANNNLYSGYDSTYWSVVDGQLKWKSTVA